jgi:excinuclease UvrABC ATPase subunit
VVEHDKDMIERADYVIDIGPKAENLVVKSSAKERQPKSWQHIP